MGQVLTQQVSRDGSSEVDESVPVAAVQCSPDISVQVQVEGLYLVVEAFQLFLKGGCIVPGAPVDPCVREAWRR